MAPASVQLSAGATPVEHADWLECLATTRRDHTSSLQALVTELRRSGTIAEQVDDADLRAQIDAGGDQSHPIAEGAFVELEDRLDACSGAYAFEVGSRSIQFKPDTRGDVYPFLLLLSLRGAEAGPTSVNAVKLFEEVCAHAAQTYLGGADQGAESYVFGFPRRTDPKGFKAALDDLCMRMGEGDGCRVRPTVRDQQDARLDVAAWKPFDDKRRGKIIGFGQCATGTNWRAKLMELQPKVFCAKWMRSMPTVLPLRMFFVPFRVNTYQWDNTCHDGGVLFDRCRLAALSQDVPDGLRTSCGEWVEHVLEQGLES